MPERQGGRQGGAQGGREDSLASSLTKLPDLNSEDSNQGGGREGPREALRAPNSRVQQAAARPPSLPTRDHGPSLEPSQLAATQANSTRGHRRPDQLSGVDVGRRSRAARRTDPAQRPTRRLVSLATAAAYADVSTRTLRRYIAQGRITGYRVGPRLVKVDLIEVDQLARPIPTVRSSG